MNIAVLLIFVAFMTISLLVVAAKSIAITREGERLVVFRLGELLQVHPPGLVLLIPFVDRGVRVRVDQVPGWQTLSEGELQQRLVEGSMKSP